jgi:putative peptidoglycan lipid II flippase
MPFVFFISSSALLAGPLQAIGHFFVPAISPVLLNIVFIIGIFVCTAFGLPIEIFCFFILFAGLLQLLLHLITYFRLGFSFEKYDKDTLKSFWHVIKKFIPCLFSMSVVEVSLFIDTSFGSYLPDGSVSLINYAERFMGIPLGVFGVAFATILLPHFSKLTLYAPKRIKFYLLEATKLIFWIAIPAVLMMMFFSTEIFSTLFSKKFTILQSQEAGSILIAYLFGVFFFSLNKILLNVFYSFHSMWTPTFISIFGTGVNFCMNMLLVKMFLSVGLAMATTISAIVQTCLYIIVLNKMFGVKFYLGKFVEFLLRYILQLSVIFTLIYFVYRAIYKLIGLFTGKLPNFLLFKLGFWLWVGPICLFAFLLIYYTRKIFKVKLYFLD